MRQTKPLWAEAVRAHGRDIGLALAVSLVALSLRVWDLTGLPAGLHGDEAAAGLEARRILGAGFIGWYSPSAAGQPAGPLYADAIAVWLWGNSVFAIRIVSAFVGAATVGAMYLFGRSLGGREFGLSAALFLALANWHIHFSRIGFPLIWWPLVVLGAWWCLDRAVHTWRLRWWAASGAVTGAGMYVYNAHYTIVAAMLLLFVFFAVRPDARVPLRWRARNAAAGVACGLLVAAPFWSEVSDPAKGYSNHFERDSLRSTPEWKDASGPFEQGRLLAGRYVETLGDLTFSPRADHLDGTGFTPIVHHGVAIISLVGLAYSWYRYRDTPWVVVCTVLLVFAVAGPTISVAGLSRRSFAAIVPVAILFACGIRLVVDLTFRVFPELPRSHRARYACVPALILAVSAIPLNEYYRHYRTDNSQEWVFNDDFTAAALYMQRVSEAGTYVLLLSERQGFEHETRLFLAPDARGENRVVAGKPDLAGASLDAPFVFILMGRYQDLLASVEGEFPGGTTFRGASTGNPSAFTAYCVGCR